MTRSSARTASASETRLPSRIPTLRDVAARAGVSAQTASNAFTSPERLAPATLERVESAVRDLGFTPNIAARALRGRRTTFIGLGVVDLSHSDMRSFAAAVDLSASAAGYRVQIVDRVGARANRNTLWSLAENGAVAIVVVEWGLKPSIRWRSAPSLLEVRLVESRSDLVGAAGAALAVRAGDVLWQALISAGGSRVERPATPTRRPERFDVS